MNMLFVYFTEVSLVLVELRYVAEGFFLSLSIPVKYFAEFSFNSFSFSVEIGYE